MTMTEEGLRWVVRLHPEETERPVNVFMYGETSQDVVVFSHRTGRWRVDPGLAARAAAEDRREGVRLSRTVDRSTAAHAAEQFGQTLPEDAEVLALMAASRHS